MLAGQWTSLNDKQNQLKYDRLDYDESMSLSKHHKNRKKECDLEDYILIKPNIFEDTYNSERKERIINVHLYPNI